MDELIPPQQLRQPLLSKVRQVVKLLVHPDEKVCILLVFKVDIGGNPVITKAVYRPVFLEEAEACRMAGRAVRHLEAHGTPGGEFINSPYAE